MSFDGSGNYTVPAGTQAISGAVIDSAKYNALLTDLQTALTKCLLRDGQSAALAAISMGGFKITSLAPGVLRTDAATLGQVQDSGFAYLSGVAGTNTITANLTPAITAYAAGQTFHFVASGANTGAATININGIGAKSITKNGTSALATGDILADSAYTLVYDGTQFQLSGSIVSTAEFAQSGANADITSLAGLTTPLSQRFVALSSGTGYSSNTTLTNSDYGQFIYLWGTMTLTLPVATVDNIGKTISLHCYTTGAITIATQSGQSIYAQGGSIGTTYPVMSAGDSLTLVNYNGTSWMAVSGSGGIGYGQTWQVVTRTSGTTYYNTTGKPIFIAVVYLADLAGNGGSLVIGGVTSVAPTNGAANSKASVTAVIPAGYSYSWTNLGSSTHVTTELR